ncbi:metal-sulfur cluster assembly factor [Companilactobacillus suantsaicola]|uniref:Metal-sulfur cluster assembly factor n=1 Tax=Companilactobacillus suantsaicola TaxID=2487723 RepID=A0A4Z0JRF6_9LACO|nr:metal-sulfur cluster assembly factor [Companilactobacillus suantsaicola]TGD24853.1 metal-sulfur cluster assembly factor [Companilactobacillus suantsaicola]
MNEDQEKKDQIMIELEDVIDPELGIDLVNLGLIYGVEIRNGNEAIVTMTLTTMGCPLSDMLNDSIIEAAESVPGIDKCQVELVWYPAWDISKMSRYARISLGIRE